MSKILILDDFVDTSTLLNITLKKKGHTCFVSADRDEGYKIAVQHTPDIVIMDLNMPGMSADEFVNATRALNPKISFILASGLQDIQEHGQNLGVTCTIQKPFDLDSIHDVVKFLDKKTD